MDKVTVVKSSVIQAYSYYDKSYTLTVTLRNGDRYQYSNVMPPVMSSVFDSGGSVGSRFMRQIARNHQFEKIEP